MRAIHTIHPDTDAMTSSVFDERAVIDAARRDPQAFAPLYQHHATEVYRFCYRRTGNPDLANDLTARIFIRAIERLDRYQPREGATFRSWLFAIARNMVADDWRRRREIHPLGDNVDLTIDPDPGPEEVALHREDIAALREVLATLPGIQADIVELRLAGLTTSEIADALGKTISAIKSAQTRAYRQIRDEMTRKRGER